jgi:hypothetical protein
MRKRFQNGIREGLRRQKYSPADQVSPALRNLVLVYYQWFKQSPRLKSIGYSRYASPTGLERAFTQALEE